MERESRIGVPAGLGLALALLLFASPSAGETSAGSVRVTDPAELAAMGFGPDAVVYRAPGAETPQRPVEGPQPDAPDEFGTLVSGYSSYNAVEFHGRMGTYDYNCQFCGGDVFHNGGDDIADRPFAMPSGSSFKGVRWWGHDNDAEDLSFFVLKTCLPAFGAGSPSSTLLIGDNSSGTPGDVSGFMIVPGVETVDNEACTYYVRVRFGTTGPTLRLYKVRAQWERQVSPAPAVATFGDVPTGHVFFQFIEALSASGITGGCSAAPPLYCPDAPLTRGQMAVFLSKALGLQWP